MENFGYGPLASDLSKNCSMGVPKMQTFGTLSLSIQCMPIPFSFLLKVTKTSLMHSLFVCFFQIDFDSFDIPVDELRKFLVKRHHQT